MNSGQAAARIPTKKDIALEETDYYILCPQRPDNAPGLITHLISVDICRARQSEGFHKCPNCVRSDIWKHEHGEKRKPKSAAS